MFFIATSSKKTSKQATKLSPYKQQLIDTVKKISEFKLTAEANVVSILYKNPEYFYDVEITDKDFSNNIWRVYFVIAYDLFVNEKKSVLDDITIGTYLEKHPKLKAKYDEYNGYSTISKAKEYVQVENLLGYVAELKKWKAVIEMCKVGFPVSERLSEYVDMSIEEIYDEFEANLNNIFVATNENVKSYNVFDGMSSFVDELNEGVNSGLPLYNAPYLNKMIGGFNLNGHIYGLGANSGVGKSTMVFNYLVPSAIQENEQMVLIINEEDESKVRKELLVWVANNIFKTELHKYVLRDGHFTDEVYDLLRKCSAWIEERKNQNILTVIPLERYTVGTVIKIIKKYSSAFGVRMFVLDTFKESQDSKTDEIYKSMMRDIVKLYDVVKPKAKNVGLFVTYQLGKNSLQVRHFTNNNIGQAKSIIDPMSVNIMMRRPYDDEFEGGNKELRCFRLEGKNGESRIPFKLEKNTNYMITFVLKNRFGETDPYQVVSVCDLSTNTCKDIGVCRVPQDW